MGIEVLPPNIIHMNEEFKLIGKNPTYVIGIKPDKNIVVVGTKEDLKEFYHCYLRLQRLRMPSNDYI